MAINPSPRFVLLLLLIHTMAAAVVFAAMLPAVARLALLVLLLLSMIYYIARDALLLFPGSWREISFERERVSIVTRSGFGFSGKLAGKTVASPCFAVLCVEMEGHRLPAFRTIFPDALGRNAFRELRVRLRFAQ